MENSHIGTRSLSLFGHIIRETVLEAVLTTRKIDVARTTGGKREIMLDGLEG